MAKIQKETIEAKGLSIQVYTEDFFHLAGIQYLDSLGMGLEIKAYSKDKTAKEPVEVILLKV